MQSNNKNNEIITNPENGEVIGQIQKIVEENNSIKPTNRAQRRALAKKNKKKEKQLQRYLTRHPEAMKIEWDEEAVKKVEEEEKLMAINSNNMEEEVIDVPFTELEDETLDSEEN